MLSLIRSGVKRNRSYTPSQAPHSTLVTGAHTPSRRESMLSQFFVLSPRGDTIISKAYRGDSPPGAAEAHMKCLELLGILKSIIEKGEGIVTAALQHLGALPVQLLRQVWLGPEAGGFIFSALFWCVF